MKKVICVILSVLMLLSCTAAFACAEETAGKTAFMFDGTVDVWGSEETGDAKVGYDIADLFGGIKVARLIDATKATGDIVIPSYVTVDGEEYKVTAITEGAFVGCRGLNSVTLPNYAGFTVVNSLGSAGIVNGVFMDCDPVITVKYSGQSAAVDTYFALTLDKGATPYIYDIDKDLTESIFAIIMKIFNAIKSFLFKLIGKTA